MKKLFGKKALVLGGTGAMGVYLVPELQKAGCKVDVVSLDDIKSSNESIKYICADAYDNEFIAEILKNEYDVIIDFLIYSTEAFKKRYMMFLESTNQYIYLSSYRVYADSKEPITEASPRLLDISDDREFLATDDYALSKARGEDILTESKYGNWTIIRPSVTYSKRRFQLVSLEANIVVRRAMENKAIILPYEAFDKQASMTWAGDVAKMVLRLILNDKAYKEVFTVATAEHNTWEYVAQCYRDLIGLKTMVTDKETYIRLISFNEQDYKHKMWQLTYDRLFNRVIDNSKILSVTGLKQSDFMPLKEGLRTELSALPENVCWSGALNDIDKKIDGYIESI